jgi:hypothetical protein
MVWLSYISCSCRCFRVKINGTKTFSSSSRSHYGILAVESFGGKFERAVVSCVGGWETLERHENGPFQPIWHDASLR